MTCLSDHHMSHIAYSVSLDFCPSEEPRCALKSMKNKGNSWFGVYKTAKSSGLQAQVEPAARKNVRLAAGLNASAAHCIRKHPILCVSANAHYSACNCSMLLLA
jgi:hypothetical protein